MLNWVKPEDELPKEGKYVLGRYARDNHIDRNDMEGVRYNVITLVKGLSKEDRAAMPYCDRSITYRHGDEEGNNLVPYAWDSFGPSSYFGQDITHWAYFDHVTTDKTNV